jgi:hypothetical protein
VPTTTTTLVDGLVQSPPPPAAFSRPSGRSSAAAGTTVDEQDEQDAPVSTAQLLGRNLGSANGPLKGDRGYSTKGIYDDGFYAGGGRKKATGATVSGGESAAAVAAQPMATTATASFAPYNQQGQGATIHGPSPSTAAVPPGSMLTDSEREAAFARFLAHVSETQLSRSGPVAALLVLTPAAFGAPGEAFCRLVAQHYGISRGGTTKQQLVHCFATDKRSIALTVIERFMCAARGGDGGGPGDLNGTAAAAVVLPTVYLVASGGLQSLEGNHPGFGYTNAPGAGISFRELIRVALPAGDAKGRPMMPVASIVVDIFDASKRPSPSTQHDYRTTSAVSTAGGAASSGLLRNANIAAVAQMFHHADQSSTSQRLLLAPGTRTTAAANDGSVEMQTAQQTASASVGVGGSASAHPLTELPPTRELTLAVGGGGGSRGGVGGIGARVDLCVLYPTDSSGSGGAGGGAVFMMPSFAPEIARALAQAPVVDGASTAHHVALGASGVVQRLCADADMSLRYCRVV